MLKPAEMRELRIVTLDEHVDSVVKRIDALGSVHLTDIKEFLNVWEDLIEPAKADEILIKTSELLARIEFLIGLLQPPEEGKKSLKELLFKEPEEEKAVKVKVEGINLEAIESELSSLEERVEGLITEKEHSTEDLSHAKEMLRVLRFLEEFDVDPGFIGEHDFIVMRVGKLPVVNAADLEESLEAVVGANHIVVSKQIRGGEEEEEVAFALVVTLKRDKEKVDRALMQLNFEPWQRPSIELPEWINDAIKEAGAMIKRLADAIKRVEREIEEIRRAKLRDLFEMQALLQIEDNKAKVKILFGQSKRVRVIEGWTPEEEVENVIAGIREETGGSSVVEVIEPKRDDVRVPSLLNNPRIVKPFESIIKMYGHPLYKDIDPTLVTAILYPILFGLMFPDIGHGAIILLIGLVLMLSFKGLDKEIRSMGGVIVLCGFCSVIVGVIFGEFFGFSTYASHLVFSSTGMHIPKGLILIENPLLEPLVQVELFFVLTLLIGALHMGLGLFLQVANSISNRDTFEVIRGFVKLWCLVGALYFLLLLFGFYFTELKEGNIPVLLRNIAIFLLLPVLALFSLKVFAELRHEEGGGSNEGRTVNRGAMDYIIILIDGVIDAVLENFFRFLANIVSYGRILALALCHMALIEVFILLAFMSFSIHTGIGALVFLAGTVIVIVLEGIMASIHTIRLHFYEWFTKFYEGGGVEFTPFKLR
ncbi:MAG: V-type ATPase 116kDa subunit family protein [Halobacteriota archaeon]